MGLRAVGVLVLALASCGDKEESAAETSDSTDVTESGVVDVDGDGDGVSIDDGDCDDADPAVHPGALEVCDGLDGNCNGIPDEGTSDSDGDGICDGVDVEECDGRDNDGDGRIDELATDVDGDGAADCVDAETCDGRDNDGDGLVDEDFDLDGDGYAPCGASEDCDDADPGASPDEAEVPGDLVDNDCDGLVDEDSWAEGDLVVTEILIDPAAVSDAVGEWLEIYNASGRTVFLDGLVLEDDGLDHHVIAGGAGLRVEVGAYAVLAASPVGAENGSVSAAYGWIDGLSLDNAGDVLRVRVPGGPTLDEVAWDATFAASGSASALAPERTDAWWNDDPASWCVAVAAWNGVGDAGSPGAENAVCASVDGDGDGFSASDGDCDDADPTVYPGAWESDPLVDQDCDGMPEQAPTAAISTDPSADQCGVVTLDGRGSSDPQGSPLAWEWSLTSAPPGSSASSADIVGAGASIASFAPPDEGTYTFSLVVSDLGGAASLPATATVEVDERVVNAAPIADAGGALTQSASVACTAADWGAEFECLPCADWSVILDGAASSDPDGDALTWSWTVLAGNAVLLDPTAASPTMLVGGAVPAAAGASATSEVYVALEVADCLGATSFLDVITVSYTCEGT